MRVMKEFDVFMRKELHAKAVEDKFERVWKQIRVSLFVRKNKNGLVKRWRESLGDRQICSVSIQRFDMGDGYRVGV